MVFVGAVILPHGTMSFDGQAGESSSSLCRDRYAGLPEALKVELSGLFSTCTKAAECIAKLEPDVILLHTPHGICLSNNVGVYLNSRAKGNALWNGEWSEFEVEVPLDKELSKKILQHLQEDKIGAEGVNSFALTEAPLRWGEVVPLWYLQDGFKRSGQQPKYVLLSQSLKKHGANVHEERMAIGRSLAAVIEAADAKVAVAISGDLSHTHTHSYDNVSLYLADPRWNMPPSDMAKIFDRAIEGWVRSCGYDLIESKNPLPQRDETMKWDVPLAAKWLDFASGLQSVALSCGIGGFLVLHGLLSHCSRSTIYSQVFGRYAPTYYGMIAAVFSFE